MKKKVCIMILILAIIGVLTGINSLAEGISKRGLLVLITGESFFHY